MSCRSIRQGRLTLATGCDFHLSFENLQELRLEPERFTLNQKNYLLVEFADFSIPSSLDQALHELQLAGLAPIITHPERNPLIRAQPERLFGWLRQGCYVQLTAQSLSGRFGRAAQKRPKNGSMPEPCTSLPATRITPPRARSA